MTERRSIWDTWWTVLILIVIGEIAGPAVLFGLIFGFVEVIDRLGWYNQFACSAAVIVVAISISNLYCDRRGHGSA